MVTTEKENRKKLNPLVSASLISRLTFWWLKDLTCYGYRHELKATDLYETIPEDQSENLIEEFQKTWEKELSKVQNNERPSLWASALKRYKWELIKYTIWLTLVIIIQITYPVLLKIMMSYFQPMTQMTPMYAYLLATTFTAMLILEAVIKYYAQFELARLGMHIKISLSQLIFRKILHMSAKTVKVGSFANLLSSDVNKIEMIYSFFFHILVIPIQTIAMTYIMACYVGTLSAFVGISLMILQTLPLQVMVYKITVKLRAKQTARTDTRIFLISEVINGIRAIKMHVWEEYFEKLLSDSRRREIAEYLKIAYVHAFMSSISNVNSRVSLLFMMVISLLRDGILETSQVVPVMKILWSLKERCSLVFLAVRSLVDADVSVKRIENFLLNKEVVSNSQTSIESDNNVVEDILSIDKVSASWTSKVDDKVLDSINIQIHSKTLCVVTGPVGSGKSTLIKLILGELEPIIGKVCVNGRVSYVDQHPWLFSGSIRENILFGEDYNEEKYQQVVKACALTEDFDRLSYSDRTLVGENGSMLSGGQRARVNLARAVYRDADIYLLDDPFSSLDVRVASEIFKKCICGLLGDKMIVLVTSNLQEVAEANLVIVLKNGIVEYQGPYIKSQLSDYRSDSMDLSVPENIVVSKDNLNNKDVLLSNSIVSGDNTKNKPKETDELLAKGGVSGEIIQEYIKAGNSYLNVFLWIVSSISLVLIAAGFDYWIVVWNQEREIIYRNVTAENLEGTVDSADSNKFLFIIGALLAAIVISALLKNFIYYRFTLIASRTIHDKMTAGLIRGPMKFFELNPSGRILNRFAEDTGNVDNVLPKVFYELTQYIIMVTTLLLPVVIINLWYTIPIAVLIYFLYRAYNFCVPSIRSVKRLERIAKSPVLSVATSCYAGRLTIRSYRAEEIVIKEFNIHQDHHTAAYFLSVACGMSFNFLIHLLSNALFAVVIYTSVLLKNDAESAGSVGLSLAQILNMTASLVFLLKQAIDIVSCMINVERMIQFTKMEQEETVDNEILTKPPASWPDEGKLEFQHVYLRYSDDIEPALKDINLVIEPRTKVGIVGRTGAGKSSLVSVLFRLTKIDGSLIIDGIDTNSVSISHLRSKLSIIPQQATLFNSTLRNNLDPFNTVEDATLWSALNDVGLKSIFNSLEDMIDKDGGNLSFGQRQLLCLARVIVKNNKILVLDEATANLDPATEVTIQKIIKSKFADCTVISVAHKLTTIIDSDKVIVMDNGQVVEYDHPHLLLQKSDGYFSAMVNQTSDNMARELKFIAEKTYTKEWITSNENSHQL